MEILSCLYTGKPPFNSNIYYIYFHYNLCYFKS